MALPEGLESRRMLATIHWDGGPTGDGTLFLDPVNWAGDVLPGPADTAMLGATGSSPTISLIGATSAARIETARVIALENGSITNSVIAMAGAGKLLATGYGGRLTGVTLAGNLDISTGHVRVEGGLTLDGGSIRLGEDGGPAATRYGTLYFQGGTQTLAGSGEIVVGSHSLNSLRAYGSSTAQSFSIGPGITIRGNQGAIEGSTTLPIRVVNEGTIVAEGPGTIAIRPITFENRGAISARAGGITLGGTWTNAAFGSITATGSTLTLGAGTGPWANLGSIAATDATVNLGGAFTTAGLGTFARTRGTVTLTGSLDNASQTLRLDDTTGSWNLLGGSITGGRYQAAGSARLVPTTTAGRLSGVTLGSDLDMTGGSVNVSGGLTLDGATVRMGGRTGGAGTITFDGGTQAIEGSGTFLFGAAKGRLLARGSDISQTLTIGAGITLRGNAGSIEGLASAPIRVVNLGVIAADGRTPDPFDLGYDQGTSGGFPGSFTDAVDLSAVADPLPEAAYRTYSSGPTLTYAFDGLAVGAEHRVRLHFVEHMAYISPRRMNVRLNGAVAQAGLDIRAEAGALFKAIARDYPVTADANGRIGITLEGVSWNAIVTAIEVFSGPARVATSDSGGAATGTISVDAVAFENRGVLWASSTETLRLTGGWTNLGTVTAFPGGRVSVAPAFGANLATIVANVNGTLNFEGSFPTASIPAYGLAGGGVTLSGALDNAGATLRLDDTTGSWRLVGGSIIGGRYEAKGSARLVATSSGGRLSGLTLAGDLDVTTGSVSVSGGMSLESATVRIGGRSTSDSGAITFDGGSQTIEGTGQIIFGNSIVNRMHVLGTAATQKLTIDPGIAIRGNGGMIEGKAAAPIQLVNKGTIVADAVTPFASDLGYDQAAAGGSVGSFTNTVDLSAAVAPLPESAYRNFRRDTGIASWLPGTGLAYTFGGLVPAAPYRVRFHFVEPEHTSNGKRQATIVLNGTTVATGFDIHAEAGGRFKAVVKEFSTAADATGQILASLRGSVAGHIAIVSGIEIFSGDTRVASSDCGGDSPLWITVASQSLVNEGTLGASGGATLFVSETSVAGWSNAGAIAVDRGTVSAGKLAATTGTVTVSRGTLSVTGDYVQTAGSTMLREGILDPSGVATIAGGTLAGSGTVKANLASAALIDVGGTAAAGTLAVEGTFSQSATGTLRVEIGRPANDLLRVTGAATLGGTLDVGVIDAGSLPLTRTVYDVLRHASVSGAFAAVSGLVDVDGRGLSMEAASDRLSIVSESRDAVPPTLAITADLVALKAGEAAVLDFALSEAVTGFSVDDVAVVGGTLSGFNGFGTAWSAVFTPTDDFEGAGLVSVAPGAFADLFGNTNAAGASLAIAVDTLRPTVAIVPSRTDIRTGETAAVTFTLSEDALDFTAADVAVTGGTLSAFAGSGKAYTALFTPTASFTGAGSIAVAAGKFADPAGNASLAGASPALSIDTLAPTIKLATSLATLRSGTTAKITFTLSKASTNFALADVVATGGTLSAFAGTGTAYSATFTPQAGFIGPGTVSVAADAFTDSTGRGNAAGALAPAIAVDTIQPSITIATDTAKLKAGETATITFTLSEESTTFVAADVTAAGGTLSAFSGSGAVYTATFTPTAASIRSGTVSVAAGKFTDKAGNLNTAGALAPALSIDTILPKATITASPTSLLFGKTAKITVTLSEASSTFTADDVTVAGGALSSFTAVSPTSYWATFTPAASSTENGTLSLASGVFTDAAGNGNVAASLAAAIRINTVQPTVAIASDKATLKTGEKATITFTLSEPSADFLVTDVKATGGLLSLFSGSGTSYSATFTPRANFTGPGTVTVAAGAFKNAATNPNLAGALSPALAIDTLPPTLKLTSDKAALKAGETATITFTASEPIALDLGNVTVGGGALSNLSGAGRIYTATFTPNASSTSSGTVAVAAGKITDLAGNTNTAAASLTAIKVDTKPPTVKVTSALASLKIAGTSKLTFTLSEASTTFTAADVSVTGGTLSAFAGTGTAYSATFTPTAGFEGEGTVSIAAGSFLDAAGNGNLAGGLATPIKIDTLAPTVLITSDLASLTGGQTTTIRFTLSEPSTTFKVTSLSVTNGTLSNFVALSATSYTVTFTPKALFKGMATVSVLAGKFTDSLGNPNIASSLLSLAIT